jgi:hypothetical protein
LVAIVILSISLTVLYRSFSSAILVPERIESRLGAVQVAQTVLEQQIGVRTLVPGTFRGSQDGYRWVLAITPAAESLQPVGGSRPWRLLSLTVAVSWRGGGPVELETLHLARAP